MSNSTYIALLVILIFLLVLLSLIVIFRFFKKMRSNKEDVSHVKQNKISPDNGAKEFLTNIHEDKIKNLQKELTEKTKDLETQIAKYNQLNNDLVLLNQKIIDELESVSHLSLDEAKSLILKKVDHNLNLEKVKLIKSFEEKLNDYINNKSIALLMDAMERSTEDVVIQNTSFKIKLDDDNIKGRIIGRDGRNKKTFETLTGVDLIIEKEPEITLSCLNPIRREKSRLLLEKLILTKNIEPSKIEKYFEQVDLEFENNLSEIGKKALENELLIFDINPELYKMVGSLKFRTSYGQNMLHHSKECAILASNIATELQLDSNKAKKAAFFHDIGKAVDFEIDNDHVKSGIKIANEYHLDDYIINAIASHHENEPCDNVYAAIAKIVDKISATRPGARFIAYDEYLTRLKTIESICDAFKGVKKSYAIKAGKQVRIIINPSIISDEQLTILSYDVKQALETNDIVNKQPIDIILIRENKIELKSSGSAQRLL